MSDQDTADLVSKGIEYARGLACLGEQDKSSVSNAVDERTYALRRCVEPENRDYKKRLHWKSL